MGVRIDGDVADGFGRVADEFARNFRRRGDVGAALTVVLEGRPVVDLWGGLRDADRRLPWERDTLVPVFSTTKGLSALAMAWLRSRGLLDWDRPVADYWPEFAQAGKESVTVRQLMAHEAGLAVLDRTVGLRQLSDLDALAEILAAQRPGWTPGARRGYHAITLGLYQNELARRVDGRTVGQILTDELAGPLGVEAYIGLPAGVAMDRVAVLGRIGRSGLASQLPGVPWRTVRELYTKGSPTQRSLGNPQMGSPTSFSRRSVLTPESPSSNGVVTARAVATLYGAAAIGDPRLPIDEPTLTEMARPVTGVARTDVLLKAKVAYADGFSRPIPEHPFGSAGLRSFGTPGYGGSFGFADPDAGLGYAWTPNRLGLRLNDDPRELAVRRAVYRALG